MRSLQHIRAVERIMPFPANRLSAQPIDPEIAGAEILHEIKNVCEVLTLAGLRENPYPMVNPHQERRWQPASSASTTAR